jgi:hypothetical protein
MPTPGIVAAAMAIGLLVIGAQRAVHGVKKAGHQIGCLTKTGHKCPPKPQQPVTQPPR